MPGRQLTAAFAIGSALGACQALTDVSKYSFGERIEDASPGALSHDVDAMVGAAGPDIAPAMTGVVLDVSDSGAFFPVGLVARFDHYSFVRNAGSYRVDPNAGVLRNDGPQGSLRAIASEISTERGGMLRLEEDGSFDYHPPSAAFWGDDRFLYRVSNGETEVEGRVRLTLNPDSIALAELRAGGNGIVLSGRVNEGEFVAGAGDVNGDGLKDVITAPRIATADALSAATLHVVYGRPSTGELSLSTLAEDPSRGFAIESVFPATELAAPDAATVNVVYGAHGVSGAGDVNGDGMDDLIVGLLTADPGGRSNAGSAYVIYGKASRSTVSLGSFESSASEGFVIEGINAGDMVGMAVAAAGDVNGDGFDDVIVGSSNVTEAEAMTGAAYVVFGGRPGPVALANLTSEQRGFAMRGIAAADQTGGAVAGAGDVNGDGLDDVIVGARLGAPGDAGAAYVVFGKRDTQPVNLGAVEAGEAGGFAILGAAASDRAGVTVASAGDTNGDGLDDVLVGAATADVAGQIDAGKVYLIYGKATRASVRATELEEGSAAGVAIHGARGGAEEWAGDQLGPVAGASDVNGDGVPDMLLGAANAASTAGPGTGRAYLLWGPPTWMNAPLSLLELETGARHGMIITGIAAGDLAAATVAGVGDFSGDGLPDLMLGSRNGGAAYLLFGWDATDSLGERDGLPSSSSEASGRVFVYDGRPAVFSGGRGYDTLRLTSEVGVLDLPALSPSLESIEQIDLGSGDHTLLLDDASLRRVPTTRVGLPYALAKLLVVAGGAGDTVRMDLTRYQLAGSNAGYDVYRPNGGAVYYGVAIAPDIRLEHHASP